MVVAVVDEIVGALKDLLCDIAWAFGAWVSRYVVAIKQERESAVQAGQGASCGVS